MPLIKTILFVKVLGCSGMARIVKFCLKEELIQSKWLRTFPTKIGFGQQRSGVLMSKKLKYFTNKNYNQKTI